MKRFEFHLSITSEDYLDYYRGLAKDVVARCTDGRAIQFPASLLTPFITLTGIKGRFVLTCTDTCKGGTIQRLPEPAATGARPAR